MHRISPNWKPETPEKLFGKRPAQISYVANFYRYYAGLADKMEGSHLPIDRPDMEVWLKREPIGVVAAIVPWNSQLFLSAVKLGPALAAGCTVVLKASEDGPAPLLEFAKLVDEAGFPPGVVNVITGFWAGMRFGTGLSPACVASRIYRGSGNSQTHSCVIVLKIWPVTSLELGGKSPFCCV